MGLPLSVLQVDSLYHRDGHCFSFLNNCREKRIKEKPAFFAGNFLGEYVTNRPGPL